MSKVTASNISGIRVAYQLFLHSRITEARRKKNSGAEKAARNALEKDRAEISDAGQTARSSKVKSGNANAEYNVSICLSELIAKLQEFSCQRTGNSQASTKNGAQQIQIISLQQTVVTQVSLSYAKMEKVNGLVVKDKYLAETDRYQFNFLNGSTLKIFDKWSNLSTTIWGDPHVDTSDEEGSYDGDFTDLAGSFRYTTFILLDDTRVTITAPDNGIIQNVDIFKGSQHLSGIGEGSIDWNEVDGFFADTVEKNGSLASKEIPVGDVVYAGGDGNDWYDADGNLVWGKATQKAVTTRPSGYYEFQYTQSITQSVSVIQVKA